jgi:hypothetical protein
MALCIRTQKLLGRQDQSHIDEEILLARDGLLDEAILVSCCE